MYSRRARFDLMAEGLWHTYNLPQPIGRQTEKN